MKRRTLLKGAAWTSLLAGLPKFSNAWLQDGDALSKPILNKGIVLSTWYNQSQTANVAAWNILKERGTALDAVVQGVMISENDWENCCVGLGGNPDRDGFVTLDASIMDHQFRCGSVAALERIKNPILVARMVMEKTPHVMLVGDGAQKFALQNGFTLQSTQLSEHADKAYKEWLIKSEYQPKINIEQNQHKAPETINGEPNHDTIGMIAMDHHGNLSGACTTSGMGFKMHGRVGDSPIIGAGLYVDNTVGAATATGHGEEVIRICGSHLVVEFMRQGMKPAMACKKAVERIKTVSPKNLKELQIGFIAINKKGEYGGYALQKGFDYGITQSDGHTIKADAPFILS